MELTGRRRSAADLRSDGFVARECGALAEAERGMVRLPGGSFNTGGRIVGGRVGFRCAKSL